MIEKYRKITATDDLAPLIVTNHLMTRLASSTSSYFILLLASLPPSTHRIASNPAWTHHAPGHAPRLPPEEVADDAQRQAAEGPRQEGAREAQPRRDRRALEEVTFVAEGRA